MNKRQKKKKGLLDQTIKIGSRVLVIKNESGGHAAGTIGEVVDKSSWGSFKVMSTSGENAGGWSYLHSARELKKLKNKGQRYFL